MIYVCSDIHGNYVKYSALLERIQLKRDDTLYVLGGVINWGPDGCKVLLDMLRRPNVVPILSKHEFLAALCLRWLLEDVTEERLESLETIDSELFQNWIDSGGGPALIQLHCLSRNDREAVLEYIMEMKPCVRIEVGERVFFLMHAGRDNWAADTQAKSQILEDGGIYLTGSEPPSGTDSFLVSGHTPTRLIRQQIGEPPKNTILRRGRRFAIDCGCGWGGVLGCLCLDTLEEFYV